ncbi:MAG: Eco57I restriction-modification methylase domain-containing protein, partial [Bradymonadaceae bacterium]
MEEGRYQNAHPVKVRGATYTPVELARFVATGLLPYLPCDPGGAPLRVLDPAVGDGVLLQACVEVFSKTSLHLFGFDSNAEAVAAARTRLGLHAGAPEVTITTGDFLEAASDERQHPYDVVIANPPYVRTQVLGRKRSRELARRHGLEGRVDLYHAFLLAMADTLRPGGVAGIITSNRFMTTRAGEGLRERLPELFDFLHVWDLGDTKLFDAAVLPCVLIARRRQPGASQASPPTRFTTIYSSSESAERVVGHPVEALEHEGLVEIEDGRTFEVRHGTLDISGRNVWRLTTPESSSFLDQVTQCTWKTFGEVGPIRVGIKTTADRVFVHDDWATRCPGRLPELLRPLITHHVGKRFRGHSPTRQVLYPHEVVDGKRRAIDLQGFPASKNYLESHRERLSARKYLIDAGRAWYELWVPQDPDAWAKPKLVFRDIAREPMAWIDLDGSIVNGDCYWMTLFDGVDEDTLWLAMAVANSTFAEHFYDFRFHNKLYAGRRRYITQYLRHFPLPEPTTTGALHAVTLTRSLYAEPCRELAAELD